MVIESQSILSWRQRVISLVFSLAAGHFRELNSGCFLIISFLFYWLRSSNGTLSPFPYQPLPKQTHWNSVFPASLMANQACRIEGEFSRMIRAPAYLQALWQSTISHLWIYVVNTPIFLYCYKKKWILSFFRNCQLCQWEEKQCSPYWHSMLV